MGCQKAKSYLVTGGAGFIGSFICDKLISNNQITTCVDNFSTGREENIKHLLGKDNFTFIKADITSPASLEKIDSKKFDYILHLASPAGPNPESPKSYHRLWQETYLANSLGTHLLCQLAKKNKAILLFASSSEIYGDPQVHPQQEDYFGHVNPIGPRAVYDESKRLGEAIVANFTRHTNLETRIVRIFNTYGPRMDIKDGRALPLFIYKTLIKESIVVYGDGNQTRSFCYIDDEVEGILKLLDCRQANALPVNIGNPNEITILQLLDKIKKIAGYLPKIIYKDLPENDPQRRRPDIKRAEKLLNWKPKIDLDEGLKRTFDYFKKI
jgi:dTDP-glucose 4,6-dehydratase